jgi:hypothetical protein
MHHAAGAGEGGPHPQHPRHDLFDTHILWASVSASRQIRAGFSPQPLSRAGFSPREGADRAQRRGHGRARGLLSGASVSASRQIRAGFSPLPLSRAGFSPREGADRAQRRGHGRARGLLSGASERPSERSERGNPSAGACPRAYACEGKSSEMPMCTGFGLVSDWKSDASATALAFSV